MTPELYYMTPNATAICQIVGGSAHGKTVAVPCERDRYSEPVRRPPGVLTPGSPFPQDERAALNELTEHYYRIDIVIEDRIRRLLVPLAWRRDNSQIRMARLLEALLDNAKTSHGSQNL